MTLSGIAFRNLAHRPWRTGLTFLGVVLAIAAYVALVGLVRGIEGTLLANFETRGADVIMTEAGAADMLSSVVPVAVTDDVRRVEGVAEASPELGRMTTIGEVTTSFVYGWPPEGWSWEALELTEGRFPVAGDGAAEGAVGGVTLGVRLAERISAGPGDLVTIFSAPFIVTGLHTTDSVLNRNGAAMLLSDMQAQTYRDGFSTSIVVRFADTLSSTERDAAIATLSSQFPGLAVDETEAMVDDYVNVRIARILSWVVSTVAVVSAALAVMNTMAMAVNERRGEIAIMGAVGWPRGRIIRCLLLEGAWLTGAGSAIGIALGVAAAWLVARSPNVEGFVEPEIGVSLVCGAVALGLGIGVVGTLVPAVRAALQDPASVLRGK
ncbi:ABC transporter permease [Maritimibacter dapengensis]|uniref:ABC transporter permease n=1 Tax=Maritimibacter dapengensis TaxID=2836868 RepID=A0ABS6SXE9_9RHOB|nr:ABC transporter permease [Maritimibacter dapengensis]MBV7377650.1 ABC transporter permease [Maritimibacter dapengensis]